MNIDEALVADKAKYNLSRDYEIFLPTNLQLKNVDLVLFNLKRKKAKTIQVKGSRTYDPRPAEVNRYGNGCGAWITMKKGAIFKPENDVDFYIFVLHSFVSGAVKKDIKIDFLIIPDQQFRRLVKKKKVRAGNKYHFFIWIDSNGKRSFEFNNSGGRTIDLSKYLNNWNILKK